MDQSGNEDGNNGSAESDDGAFASSGIFPRSACVSGERPLDEERIARLRALVAEGRLEIDVVLVAERMLEDGFVP